MSTKKDLDNLIVDGIEIDERELLMNNLKAVRILRFSLPRDTFCLVSSFPTAKKIWDMLKELYFIDADLTHSVKTTLLSEFGSFEKKPDGTIDKSVNCFNHLLCECLSMI